MVSNGKNHHAERKESEDFDDISEAERLHKEDKRMHRLREHENGGDGNLQSEIRIFEGGSDVSQGEVRETVLTITQDKEAKYDILAWGHLCRAGKWAAKAHGLSVDNLAQARQVFAVARLRF